MNQQDQFNEILNQCLERLLKGESINQILSEFPDQAQELQPLLRTASAARAFSEVQPRADFKARARYEFITAARELETQPKGRFVFKWKWQPAWAISLAAVAVVVLSGGATVVASNSSMPGQSLYSVKLAFEKVQLAFTVSDLAETELNARFANNRAAEIEYLAVSGNTEQIQIASARLNSNLSNISQLFQGEKAVSNVSSDPPPKAPLASAVSAPTDAASQSLKSASGAAPASAASPEQAFSAVSVTPATAVMAVPSVTAPVTAPAPLLNAGSGNTSSATGDTLAVPVTNPPGVRNQNDNSNLLSKKEKMRKIIEENYQIRQAKLKAALEKASPDSRPAILQAIADSEREYWKSIQNLDQTSN